MNNLELVSGIYILLMTIYFHLAIRLMTGDEKLNIRILLGALIHSIFFPISYIYIFNNYVIKDMKKVFNINISFKVFLFITLIFIIFIREIIFILKELSEEWKTLIAK